MSKVTVSFPTSRLRARLASLRRQLPIVVATRLKSIAEKSFERHLAGLPSGEKGRVHNAVRRLNAVFVPVTLKHRRREKWPDLWPIYQARIVRREATYRGQRRFWVDRTKLEALRLRVLKTSVRRLDPQQWRIVVTAVDGGVHVRLFKKGRRTKADAEAASAIVSLIHRAFAEESSAMLYEAMARS